ncbi:MAG: leucine-rich repeat domain-containing protein, partial [Chitinophagales bacterium]|nr:leucine-rich repeat domain-containing protein [Chitinophagales bacterium]
MRLSIGFVLIQNSLPEIYISNYMNLQEALSRIQKARESQLSTLDIANCSLTEIPAEVFELAHLTELKLGHWSDYGKQHKNNITVIPPAIAQLNKLQQLDVSSNELTELPNALAQLRQLHTLETSNNRLTNLPNIFGQLVNLQTLDLSNNQISQVPASLSHLPRLQRLNLSKNQLSTLPPD